MTIRFRGKARNLSVVQCYAPTEDTNPDTKQAFYDALNNILAKVPKRDLVVLMGDFNAKVGSNNDAIEDVIGKHGVGEMNEAEVRYKALDKRVKREIRNDKREQLNAYARQVEAAVYNMKDLFDITKRIAGTCSSRNVPVKDKNGVLLTNVEDQLKRMIGKKAL